MARLLIVTPAPPGSRQGNRVTAKRWAGILKALGHEVKITEEYKSQRCDVLIALHARKSAPSIETFVARQAPKPVLLALTGTDLYGDIRTNRAAQQSLELATRLILLQPHGIAELSKDLQEKSRVIFQSDVAPANPPAPLQNVFEICVSGHLRPVKDPFRAAMAARKLPADSRIHITHLGAALTPEMRERARAEMARNPRYHWLGEVSRGKARRLLARSRLLLVSSKLEGGANVVSEALAAGVPVISTQISGSIGLLGEDYPGYFPVGDTDRLMRLMYRCENDLQFYRGLKRRCRARAAIVKPSRELQAWRQLLREVL